MDVGAPWFPHEPLHPAPHGSAVRGPPGGKAALRPRSAPHGQPVKPERRLDEPDEEERYGRRDRLPATEGRDVAVRWSSEPAVLPFGSPASVITTPPPPHRSALGAYRPSYTLRPALCTALVPSLPRPARRRVDPSIRDGAGGIRTHGLELMRLARTAAPLPRDHVGEPTVPHEPPPSGSCTGRPMRASRAANPPSGLERLDARIWSAGLEPAISDARSRWGGQSPLRPGGS